jgi:hypothetical protein
MTAPGVCPFIARHWRADATDSFDCSPMGHLRPISSLSERSLRGRNGNVKDSYGQLRTLKDSYGHLNKVSTKRAARTVGRRCVEKGNITSYQQLSVDITKINLKVPAVNGTANRTFRRQQTAPKFKNCPTRHRRNAPFAFNRAQSRSIQIRTALHQHPDQSGPIRTKPE